MKLGPREAERDGRERMRIFRLDSFSPGEEGGGRGAAMTYSQTQHPYVTSPVVFSPFRTGPLLLLFPSPCLSLNGHIFLCPAIIRLKLPVRAVPRKTYNARNARTRWSTSVLPVGVIKRSLQIHNRRMLGHKPQTAARDADRKKM